jgi:glycine hydroxymethyltransferase
MADIAHIAGLIVAGEMNNPVGLFDVVTTTTHKTLRGPRGGMIICKKELAKKIDSAVFPGLQGGPHENNIAAKAIAFGEALKPEFKIYAHQIKLNAKALCASLQNGGMKIMFGGTDNHLILADVTPLGLGGKEAQNLLDSVGITLNMNMIPDDTRSPFDPSGIRLGTPAMTTRGFTEQDFAEVGELIVKTLKNKNNSEVLEEVKIKVKELTDKYPLYPELI